MSTRKKYMENSIYAAEIDTCIRCLIFLAASVKGYPKEFTERFLSDDGLVFEDSGKVTFTFVGATVEAKGDDGSLVERLISWDDLRLFHEEHRPYINLQG